MKREHILLLGFILIKCILQFILIHPVYELQRDEFLHLDLGKHLAWGYISVPPVTAWISWVILSLGGGEFWVKFFPALIGVLTLYLVWRMIKALDGGIWALCIGCLAILISPLLRVNTLFQPNSLDIFCWTLLFYCLIRLVQTNNNRWLYAAAVTFAFGFLCKYNIAFLATGLFVGLLLGGQHRLLANKHLYVAGIVALVMISPNLLWQINNDFPTFHQLRELSETQLVNVNRADFIKDQLIYFINSFFLIVLAWIGLYKSAFFKNIQFILFTYITVILLFLFFRAKSYYAIGLYPVLMAIGAVYLERITTSGWKRHFRIAAVSLILLLAIPFFLVGFPNKHPDVIKQKPGMYKTLGMLRWEDGKDHALPQDYADMLGWKELASEVDAAWQSLQGLGHTIIICENYGLAGAINYYSKIPAVQAVSFNADYINWFDLHTPIVNLILVIPETDAEDEVREAGQYFTSMARAGRIDHPDAREHGAVILVFRKAQADINAILAAEIDSLRRHE
jgi:hypothetical protein